MQVESNYHQRRSLPRANHVDLQQFVGDWYMIAHIPAPYERNSNNAVQSFRWNEDEDKMEIDFHFNEGSPTGELKQYHQKAWFTDPKTHSDWKVQFIWPFRLSFRILEVAPDYCWAILGTKSKSFVWILARKDNIEADTFEQLMKKLDSWNYDITKVRKVPQIWNLS